MKRPVLRWALPVLAAAVVLGLGAVTTALRASADPSLPSRTAAQLLVDLQTARLDGLSGTVVQRADLGLPGVLGALGASSELGSVVNGTRTVRIWYSGPDKLRVALLGKSGESDLIRNGRDVWTWSSDSRSANHRVLPESWAGSPLGVPHSPQEAADRLLSAIDPSTVVSTSGTAKVAGRAAYDLTLAPRDRESLISQVRVAIDGEHRVPLRLRVYAKGRANPAFEMGFTQVSFARPGDEHFRFVPPAGTMVNEDGKNEPDVPGKGGVDGGLLSGLLGAERHVVTVGTAWTTVLVARLPGEVSSGLGPVLGNLPRVSGRWGAGRLLTSHLVSALVTDDGRLLVGAVTPERLYAAAADPKAALTR